MNFPLPENKNNPPNTSNSEKHSSKLQKISTQEMVLNVGPQHPSTHGVLRLEVITDGELVIQVIPHLGYLHRCFEKHAEALNYQQIIPYVDRMDYVSAMNNEFAYAMTVEKMLGLTGQLPKRIEYIRVLVAELNRIASHLVAIGTYAMDIGAITPFLWCFRDREHILNLLEWASGARMLYNYIWIGGLFYDIPIGFEEKCQEFCDYFYPKIIELEQLISENPIFLSRTVGIGILPLSTAIDFGVTGPMLRASGLKYDIRKIDAYSVYPELDFDIPYARQDEVGKIGDCWMRYKIRVLEMYESLKIVKQCAEILLKKYPRTPDFDPRKMCPKKIRPKEQVIYSRAENPRGELGFFIVADGKSDIPYRCKVRAPSFCNLSVLPELCKGVLLSDLIAILGSIDIVLGEVDR